MARFLLAVLVLLVLVLVGAAPAVQAMPIFAIRYARDPDTVLVATAGVSAYDRTTGALRWRLAPPPSARTRAVVPLHHADAAVVGNDDGEVLLVDTRGGTVLRTLAPAAQPVQVPGDWVLGLAVSADDRLAVAVGLGGAARMWRLPDGERMPLPPAATGTRLEAATFTRDGRTLLLAGLYEDAEREGPEPLQPLRVVDLVRGTVREVALDDPRGCRHGQSVALAPAEDRVALACFGGRLTMFGWPSLEPLWSTDLSINWAGPLAFEADGSHVLVMTAEAALRVDAATGTIVARSSGTGGSGATNDLAVHPNGTELLHGDRVTGHLVRRALPSLDLVGSRRPAVADPAR